MLLLAIPSFQTILQKNRTVAAANSFLIDILRARNEAVTQSLTVTICAITFVDSTNCSSNVLDWSHGWIAFYEGSDKIIFKNSVLPKQIRFMASPSASITYNPQGILENNAAGNYDISLVGCSGDNAARRIRMNASGAVKLSSISCI